MHLINIVAICSVLIRGSPTPKAVCGFKTFKFSLHFSMTITKISSRIKNVCNKTNRLLGFLRRNLDHCSSNLKETAYKHLILPCLGYCAPIWDPFHHNLIYQMEMVQHRAAHLALNQPRT